MFCRCFQKAAAVLFCNYGDVICLIYSFPWIDSVLFKHIFFYAIRSHVDKNHPPYRILTSCNGKMWKGLLRNVCVLFLLRHILVERHIFFEGGIALAEDMVCILDDHECLGVGHVHDPGELADHVVWHHSHEHRF